MREQLNALREKMRERHVDGYLIPTTDFHGSEYVNDYFKCREYISGFTGSAGTLLVLMNDAMLWTDGRYFLQAADQLAGSGIRLMKEGEPETPTLEDALKDALPQGGCLGFDGRVVNFLLGEKLEKNFNLSYDMDLAGQVWEQRPVLKPSKIYPLSDQVTGEGVVSKLKRVRQAMEEEGADYHLITKLEEIAWLTNLRGRDVANTPVFFAFALIEKERARFFVLDERMGGIGDRWDETAQGRLEILPYFEIFRALEELPAGRILLDEKVASYAAVKAIPENVRILNEPDPAELMKAVKNPIEIESAKAVHVKDGIAMVEFIHWLKENVGKTRLSELSVSDYLEECRRRNGAYDLSFVTISGYMEHGAIVHYEVTEDSDKELGPEGFLLVDSGGQYDGGTTDITRTIALGPLSDKMKEHYTLVMKSHIALATARFAKGISGLTLDQLTREPLKAAGLDYKHGTGHGVGHMLSVHEGPCTISLKGENSPILPAMILSDEPGIYLEGQYGIRLENEILCIEGTDDFCGFEPITWCPWERQAIVKEMLTEEEIAWIDQYHQKVYEILSPGLQDAERQWLKGETAPL
ncbi:MAG: aminopeptidase P family protein [Firmicutes bacterium]|nr:aminopeptidase P family protein [Bacillota bacterium]